MKDDLGKEEDRPTDDDQELPPDEATEEVAESETEAAVEVEEDLDKMLGDTRRQRDEYLELAQRTKADFENYRKRMVQDVASASDRGKKEIIGQLLPVLDNLERAQEAARSHDQESQDDQISDGVRLVQDELGGIVKRAGVESFEPDGEQFDPNLHEAVMTKPEEGVDTGTVVEVVQKGYRYHDHVIRHAKVVVAE